MGPVLIVWRQPVGWDRIGGMEVSLYHFLSRCARVEIGPMPGEEIRAAARALESENPRWDGVAALAHLVYPEPGLRPMGDLDLLIPAGKLPGALEALYRLGYQTPPPVEDPGWLAGIRLIEPGITQVVVHSRI